MGRKDVKNVKEALIALKNAILELSTEIKTLEKVTGQLTKKISILSAKLTHMENRANKLLGADTATLQKEPETETREAEFDDLLKELLGEDRTGTRHDTGIPEAPPVPAEVVASTEWGGDEGETFKRKENKEDLLKALEELEGL